MKINMKKVRRDMRRYRRKFNEEFLKCYGVSFRNYVDGTKRYLEAIAHQANCKKLTRETLKAYQTRILCIKEKVDGEYQ